MLDVQARVLAQQLIQQFSLVGLGVVEEGDQGPPQMPQQMAQENTDFVLSDVPEPELIVEAEALSFRTYRDPGNDGDLVPPITMTNDRSVAAGGPGLDDIGDQQEARFVGEDEMGTQPRSVFFTRSQSFRFQRSMASPSRSTARVSGF